MKVCFTRAVFGIGVALLISSSAFGGPYTIGDVFASIGGGKVNEYTQTGTLVRTLDNGLGSTYTTGSVFDKSGNFYVTTFSSNVISKFDNAGNLVNGSFVTGFNADVESITRDKSGNFFAGEADGARKITEFDSTGTVTGTWSPTTGPRGTDWVDLSADQHTVYYTSEGGKIYRFDTSTGTQLSDFTDNGTAEMYEFRILADGSVLAANTDNILHFDSSGNIIHTYSIAHSGILFALNLDPDGKSFWTGDLGGDGNVFKIDIATGTVLENFSTGSSSLAGLSVFGEITQGGGGGGGSTVPEPNSVLLLGGALIGLLVYRKRAVQS